MSNVPATKPIPKIVHIDLAKRVINRSSDIIFSDHR